MRELSEEYGSDVEIEIKQARSEEGQAAVETYGFGAARHGLVAFARDGEVGFVLQGHDFKKADIEAKLKPLVE